MRIETSDHAALRWLQRVEGVNVAAIKRRIAERAKLAVELHANGTILDGVKLHIAYPAEGVAVVTTTICRKENLELAEPRLEAGKQSESDEH